MHARWPQAHSLALPPRSYAAGNGGEMSASGATSLLLRTLASDVRVDVHEYCAKALGNLGCTGTYMGTRGGSMLERSCSLGFSDAGKRDMSSAEAVATLAMASARGAATAATKKNCVKCLLHLADDSGVHDMSMGVSVRMPMFVAAALRAAVATAAVVTSLSWLCRSEGAETRELVLSVFLGISAGDGERLFTCPWATLR